jgi:hypothetical protein
VPSGPTRPSGKSAEHWGLAAKLHARLTFSGWWESSSTRQCHVRTQLQNETQDVDVVGRTVDSAVPHLHKSQPVQFEPAISSDWNASFDRAILDPAHSPPRDRKPWPRVQA